jgi:aminoglycoside 6'-N-acetyltransferase I
MHIEFFDPGREDLIRQAAELLVEEFREHYPDAWPTLEDALQEVRETFIEDRFALVALDDKGPLIGWIGARPDYARVWELHPLVVRSDRQRQGIGRQLVLALEAEIRQRGGLTLMLGTDDQDDQTTLSGIDLYADIGGYITTIRNLRGHPYEFYQKLGYTIVGVVPDANGIGKPDILMAKRIATS